MLKKCLSVLVLLGFVGIIPAHALESYYSNNQIYNNKIPYSYYFGAGKAQPEKIKVQKANGNGNVVQAVVPVNEKEDKVEQQSIKK